MNEWLGRFSRASFAMLTVAATLPGCASLSAGRITGRQLVELDEAWATAAATGELDTIMDFWTDDAILFPEGQPPVYGKLAIRKFLENRPSNPGYRIAWTPCCAGVDEHGAMGYTLGEGAAKIIDESGAPRELSGRYVAIWRNDDGRWRCAVKCWNSSPHDRRPGRAEDQ